MSGGYFGYEQDAIGAVADEVGSFIENNGSDKIDEYGERIWPEYQDDIIALFKESRDTLKIAEEMLRRIDWLLSGDDGEDSFRRRWEESVEPLKWWKRGED